MSGALPLTRVESVNKTTSYFSRKTITVVDELPTEEHMILIGRDNAVFNEICGSFKSSVRLGSVLKALEFIKQHHSTYRRQWLSIVLDNFGTTSELELLHRFVDANGLTNNTIFILHCDNSQDAGFDQLSNLAPYCNDVVNILQIKANLLKRLSFLRKTAPKREQKNSLLGEMLKTVKAEPARVSKMNIGKRALDITVSGLLILVLSPILLLITLLIRLEGKGPIFYTSKRAGKGYKIFDFYKFRTMVPDADKKVAELLAKNQYTTNGGDGPVFFKLKNDPRITRLGAFLRNTSLDELPQLFNVLKGDMSLVGNRPLPLYEAETLTTDSFAERFMAPAGITGLWQVKKRGHVGEMSVEERINLDIEYAKKHSFMYDLWIMASTPKALLQKENV